MNELILVCLLAVVYAFLGYPLLLLLLTARKSPNEPACLFGCEGRDSGLEPEQRDNTLPSFSVLLAVHNEEAAIKRKMENFLALDYPSYRLEMLIVSDGSSDATDDIVSSFAGNACGRIRLLRQKERQGKTEALNMAALRATGKILLFTDADALFRPDCAMRLAEAFADPEVGLAGGRSIYVDELGRESDKGIYRRYEEWIKEKEGRLYGIIGADGAVYAMRRELYTELNKERITDLAHPVEVVLAGKKAIGAPEALVFEKDESSGQEELARQTRIMAQSWLIVFHYFIPLVKRGRIGYLWQLLSHKPLRWLTLPLLCIAGLAALLAGGFLAQFTLVGLAALAVAAFWGGTKNGGRLTRLARLFLIQHAAAVYGLVRLLRGDKFVIWTPRGR